MAKNSITDYDNTAANNTDVQSVDISEGCSPSGINNAIREVMADLADVNDGTVALTSPKFDSIKDGNITPPDASGTDIAGTDTTIKGGAGTGTGAGGSIIFQTADGGSTGSSVNAHATAMTITDDGSIDINGNDLILDADADSKIEASTDDTINIISGGTTGLTVDSSGRVLQPEKPSFHAYRDSSVAEGLTGAIVFNNVRYNKGSHYSTTTGKFTAPVDGVYHFSFTGFGCNSSAGFLAAGAPVYVDLHNETLGVILARTYHVSNSSTGYSNMSFGHSVYLDANDVIKIIVNNQYIYSDTSDIYLMFSGHLVG